MTDREIMQQALDALKLHLTHHEHGCVYLNPVMYALEAALAQPEQAPVAWVERDGELIWHDINAAIGKNLYTAPISEPVKERISEPLANQEPVAWQVMVENEPMKEFSIKDMAHDWAVTEKRNGSKYLYWLRPLYAAPPRKEWVGRHLDDMPEEHVVDRSFLRGARWAEAKLKEKNGG